MNDKCLHKIIMTGIDHDLYTKLDEQCHGCSGYDYDCHLYTSMKHLQSFNEVFDARCKIQEEGEHSYIARLKNQKEVKL